MNFIAWTIYSGMARLVVGFKCMARKQFRLLIIFDLSHLLKCDQTRFTFELKFATLHGNLRVLSILAGQTNFLIIRNQISLQTYKREHTE